MSASKQVLLAHSVSPVEDVADGSGNKTIDGAFDTADKIMGGVSQAILDLPSFFTTPLGIATLGTGSLPAVAQRIIAGAFATQMAAQTPEIARQIGAEFGKPSGQRDVEKIANLVTSGLINTGFTVDGALHALVPKLVTTDSIPSPANDLGFVPDVVPAEHPPNQILIPGANETLPVNPAANANGTTVASQLTPPSADGTLAQNSGGIAGPSAGAPPPSFTDVNQANRPGAEAVPADNLFVGDTFKLNGQTMKVTGTTMDGETGQPDGVELDGAYGPQTVPTGTAIHLDAGTLKSPDLKPPTPAANQPLKMVVANLSGSRGGMTKEAVAASIADLRQSLNNSHELYIAQNLDALPEHLRIETKQLLQNHKLVRGIFDNDVVYMVADHIPDATTAKTVFLEEALGHAGMEPLIKPQEIDQLYSLIWDGARVQANDIAKNYGQDLSTPEGRKHFVEEFVAKASAWWLEKPRLWRQVTDVLLRAAYRVSALHNIAPSLILHAQMRGLTKWAAARLSDAPDATHDQTLSSTADPADPAYDQAVYNQSAASKRATSQGAQAEEVSQPERNITTRFNQVPDPNRNPGANETLPPNPGGITDLAVTAQDLQAALRDNQLKPARKNAPETDLTSASEPDSPETANAPSQPAAGTLVPPAPVASGLPRSKGGLDEENTREDVETEKPTGISVKNRLDKSSDPSTASSGLGLQPTPEPSPVKPPVFSKIKQAFNWALQNIRGTVRNQATGFDIAIARSGIAKTLSGKAVEKSNSLDAHLAALRQLPKLLQRADLTESRPALKKTDSISTIYRFTTPFDFNGQSHTVKMTVREIKEPAGKNFYTLETAEIEKPAGNISMTDSLDKSSNPSIADSGLDPKLTPEPPSVKPAAAPENSRPEDAKTKTAQAGQDEQSNSGNTSGLSKAEVTRRINGLLGTNELPPGIEVIHDETAPWGARIEGRNKITVNAAQIFTPEGARAAILEEGLHGVWDHPDVQRAWQSIRDLVTPEEMYAERQKRLAQGLPADAVTIREEAAVARVIKANANRGVFARLYDTIRDIFKRKFGIALPATARQQLKDAALEFLRNRNNRRGAKDETNQTKQPTRFATGNAGTNAIGSLFKDQRDLLPVVSGAPKIEAGNKIQNSTIVQRAADY
ncbi:MAG TPA: hypothetical protein VGO57_14820, partial [Verrucomicrobiae bacterium]